MSKKAKKELDNKLQVKLPDSLKSENILNQLEEPQKKVAEFPQKKSVAKILIPIAASFMVVVGLVGMYFGMGFNKKESPATVTDYSEVVKYESYDKIYERFDSLHKQAEKDRLQNGFANFLTGSAGVPEAVVDDEATADDTAANANSFADKGYGTTNNQVEGVEEGDIIKTDGNYLYVINGENAYSMSIIDCTTEKMTQSALIELPEEENVTELYIWGNYVVLVGSYYDPNDTEQQEYNGFVTDSCCVGWMSGKTVVNVYDVSDKTVPKKVTSYIQQGSYNSSRMIGSKLYSVSTYYVNVYGDDYRDYCIPEVTINGKVTKIAADCISVLGGNDTTYAVITTLDLSVDKDPSSEAILGDCNKLYATQESIFLMTPVYEEGTKTNIYKFDYTDTGVEYKCTGSVPGYINDQFSVSYDGGYFRIATTVDKIIEETTRTGKNAAVSSSMADRVNNLYILNSQLQQISSVEDLAKGESIQSVRFVGDMAYVVTFLQTDPLFVIDLSDPNNPTVKAELKIPGFSEYLHPIADGLLVGVGFDGTDKGTNGDCKVSLFDVTDPYNPKETSVLTVSNGTANCYPCVANNHKLYIKLSENEFAVPFRILKYVNGYNSGDSSICYIRYRLEGNSLTEVARYTVDNIKNTVLGATYIENTFYAVAYNYSSNQTQIVAYDLVSNTETDRLVTDR